MSFSKGAKEIDKLHKSWGWDSCGYHHVVRYNGIVEKCRPEEKTGAHVKGHNKNTIGIAWAGKKHPTEAQYKSLVKLTVQVLKKYGLSVLNVAGHKIFDTAKKQGKTCPDIDMTLFELELLREW